MGNPLTCHAGACVIRDFKLSDVACHDLQLLTQDKSKGQMTTKCSLGYEVRKSRSIAETEDARTI